MRNHALAGHLQRRTLRLTPQCLNQRATNRLGWSAQSYDQLPPEDLLPNLVMKNLLRFRRIHET